MPGQRRRRGARRRLLRAARRHAAGRAAHARHRAPPRALRRARGATCARASRRRRPGSDRAPRRAARRPAGDLLQAGPLLVRGGVPCVDGDAEGFSAGQRSSTPTSPPGAIPGRRSASRRATDAGRRLRRSRRRRGRADDGRAGRGDASRSARAGDEPRRRRLDLAGLRRAGCATSRARSTASCCRAGAVSTASCSAAGSHFGAIVQQEGAYALRSDVLSPWWIGACRPCAGRRAARPRLGRDAGRGLASESHGDAERFYRGSTSARRLRSRRAPMHPSYEDRAGALDGVFAAVDDGATRPTSPPGARLRGGGRRRGRRAAPAPPHPDPRGGRARRARGPGREPPARHRAADARGIGDCPPAGWRYAAAWARADAPLGPAL